MRGMRIMPPFLGHVVCLFFQQIKSTLHVDTKVASAEWPEMHTLLTPFQKDPKIQTILVIFDTSLHGNRQSYPGPLVYLRYQTRSNAVTEVVHKNVISFWFRGSY